MTDHAAVVQGMAAGVGGAVLALLGVDASTLTAALFGCALGALFAPPTTRLKAALQRYPDARPEGVPGQRWL